MPCQCCGDKNTSLKFCGFCDKLYFKNEKIRSRTKEDQKEEKRPVTPLQIRPCEECKKDYKPKTLRQKFCSDDCRPKPISEFDRWMNAKPRAKNLDSDQVGYGFFRKKYGTSNRLKVCRG